MKKNLDVRKKAKEQGVYLWEIADRLGLRDSCFSRRLRKELPEGEKERIFIIIDELARERIENEEKAV